jgi:hypothetical protein
MLLRTLKYNKSSRDYPKSVILYLSTSIVKNSLYARFNQSRRDTRYRLTLFFQIHWPLKRLGSPNKVNTIVASNISKIIQADAADRLLVYRFEMRL